MIDKEEIVRALTLWFQPGDVFEIRALGASTGLYRNPHTETGYFDFEHIKEAADAIEKIRFADGIYVTINPVKKNLLARAVYKLLSGKNAAATGDDNIERRHWLLIDCDPVRESGIASNDVEHEAAIAKAKEIREELSKIGWQNPILTDSGNGAHLTYRIDLPTADDGLVQSVLTALQYFNDDKVKIDLSVFNPARIVRLPGTMNRKGDDADGKVCGRPHRMAKILEAPESIVPVTEEQLKIVLGGEQPSPTPVVQDARDRVFYEDEGFNLDEWIAQYAPDAGPPIPYNKGGVPGRKWRFKVCPFNPEQTNDPAVITEFADGGIQFRCLHDSCSGNDWKKFRVLRQPGCYDHKKALEYPDVDISGILGQTKRNNLVEVIEKPVELETPWRKVTDGDILKAIDGTLFGRLCHYFCGVSEPALPIAVGISKALALCGAALSRPRSASPTAMAKMGLQGNLAGHVGIGPLLGLNMIDTGGGQIPNFYSILVAPSSSGKDIGGLLEQLAVRHQWYIGDAGSPEGLADAFIKCPNGILSISELQPWLDVKCWQHNAVPFLTKSFNKGFFKSSFSSRGGHGNTRAADFCYPNILACVQPDVLRKIADKSDLENGFLGRFLFARMEQALCQPNTFDLQKTLDEMSLLVEAFKRKEGIIHVEKGYSAELGKLFSKNAPEEIDFSWKRLINEYYPRFAFLLSVTDAPATQRSETELKTADWERAERLVLWFFANAERLLLNIEDQKMDLRVRTRENLLEKVCRKIQRLEKGNGVSIREISVSGIRNSNAKERREAVNELVDRGIITLCEDGRYKVIRCPPEWQEEKTDGCQTD